MIQLEDEVNRILSRYPNVQFKVPDVSQIKRYLDNVEYEKRRTRIKKSEKQLIVAIEYLNGMKGAEELSPEAKKKIIELARKVKESGE